MKPTDEQIQCLDLFAGGESMVIEAGAGSGKTTTLRLLAESTERRGRYLAFNKAIVTDVAGKMPATVVASTAHSLAFRSVGKRYAHRLNGPRMKSWDLAQRLRTERFAIRYGAQSKILSDQFLAGLAMRAITNFCSTADGAPGVRHVPYIDGLDVPRDDGLRTFANNNELAKFLLPAIERAWADIQRTNGSLPFKHEHYLKLYQLSHPIIDADFVLFDEAQDASPVMAAIVAEQDGQCVYVGDSAQAIYEWTGAVNALAAFDTERRAILSTSFRFGPEIAGVANVELDALKAPLRLTGSGPAGSVGELSDDEVSAILTRTNAEGISEVMRFQALGKRPHLVGGGAEVASFARGAEALKEGGRASHPDLVCFDSWGEVQDYVDRDAQGFELRLLVRLVDEFSVPVILDTIEKMPPEDRADVVISTAHKAKGREWDRVRLAGDFAGAPESLPETRLRYVAVTRARLALDDSQSKRKPPVGASASDALHSSEVAGGSGAHAGGSR